MQRFSACINPGYKASLVYVYRSFLTYHAGVDGDVRAGESRRASLRRAVKYYCRGASAAVFFQCGARFILSWQCPVFRSCCIAAYVYLVCTGATPVVVDVFVPMKSWKQPPTTPRKWAGVGLKFQDRLRAHKFCFFSA